MLYPDNPTTRNRLVSALNMYLEFWDREVGVKIQDLARRKVWIQSVSQGKPLPETHRVVSQHREVKWPALPPEIFDFVPEAISPERLRLVDRVNEIAIEAGQFAGRDDVEAVAAVCNLESELVLKSNEWMDVLRDWRLRVENQTGKLTKCDECGRELTPSQVSRGRCCDCIARQRKTLRWLGTAIECEYRYENRVYGDGFDLHFPEWSRWRRRLRECYGRDRTDRQLWEDWIGYAQEYRGIDEQQFKGTLRSEAESLLPPIPITETVASENATGCSEAAISRGTPDPVDPIPLTVARTDDRLPKSKRAASPSRVKARSAYDYAIERIENAHAMTGPELHAAILEDGEAAAMVPANPETFVRYLNDGGIRLKKGESKSAGGSVVRRSDL